MDILNSLWLLSEGWGGKTKVEEGDQLGGWVRNPNEKLQLSGLWWKDSNYILELESWTKWAGLNVVRRGLLNKRKKLQGFRLQQLAGQCCYLLRCQRLVEVQVYG